MNRVLAPLASTRLTVLLCLVLAAASVAGSFLYRGNTSFGEEGPLNVFRSPLFLVPAALLAANVAACTLLRVREAGLALAGWPFLGLHLGILLASAGLLVDGILSSTATRYYLVGVPAADRFDWREGKDLDFPFRVEVADFRVEYHPLPLRLGVKGRGGEKHGPYETREGVPFRVPSLSLTAVPGTFDFATGLLPVAVTVGGVRRDLSLRQGEPARLPGGEEVHLLARFRERSPSGYRVVVRFLPPAPAPAVEREVRVNRPASYGGYLFAFTDYQPGEEGETLVGLQMTREPGAPWFWAGTLLFLASLGARLLRRVRRAAPAPPAVGSAAPLLLLLLLLPLPSRAGEAPAPGRRIRWEGEVKVGSVVRIGEGDSLTVAPGATVLLSTEDRDGDGSPDGRIEVVKGTFEVLGEKGREVRFLPAGGKGRWDEIFLLEAAGDVRHARFEGARYALHVHFGEVKVVRSLFRGNGGGARSRGTGLTLDRCDFEGNGVALRFWDGGPRVTRSRFEGNGTALFYRDGGGGGKIDGSVFRGNSEDLRVGDWARGSLDLSGNHFGGAPPSVTDFRDAGEGGTVRWTPVLAKEPPAGRSAP